MKQREGIGKRVCLKVPAVAVNFDAVSASSVFLVFLPPKLERLRALANSTKVIEILDNLNLLVLSLIVKDDKVLFCGADVAKALGYAKPQNAIDQYCRNSTLIKDLANREDNNKGAIHARKYIQEGDVYRLIVSSKLPYIQPRVDLQFRRFK